MFKVIDIVRDILYSSEPELTILSRRLLNLSAYAKRIQLEVERRAHKEVQLGSIVVALSRISQELTDEDPLLPEVKLDGIAVKSNIAEIAFNKTPANKAKATKLTVDKELSQADFLTVTYGASEISVFAPMTLMSAVSRTFRPEKPKLLLNNLAALTVQFGNQYIETPNMYFALLRAVAVKRINIVELISTYTELTFLVRQDDLNELFQTMNALILKRK
jgi:aspartokinase